MYPIKNDSSPSSYASPVRSVINHYSSGSQEESPISIKRYRDEDTSSLQTPNRVKHLYEQHVSSRPKTTPDSPLVFHALPLETFELAPLSFNPLQRSVYNTPSSTLSSEFSTSSKPSFQSVSYNSPLRSSFDSPTSSVFPAVNLNSSSNASCSASSSNFSASSSFDSPLRFSNFNSPTSSHSFTSSSVSSAYSCQPAYDSPVRAPGFSASMGSMTFDSPDQSKSSKNQYSNYDNPFIDYTTTSSTSQNSVAKKKIRLSPNSPKSPPNPQFKSVSSKKDTHGFSYNENKATPRAKTCQIDIGNGMQTYNYVAGGHYHSVFVYESPNGSNKASKVVIKMPYINWEDSKIKPLVTKATFISKRKGEQLDDILDGLKEEKYKEIIETDLAEFEYMETVKDKCAALNIYFPQVIKLPIVEEGSKACTIVEKIECAVPNNQWKGGINSSENKTFDQLDAHSQGILAIVKNVYVTTDPTQSRLFKDFHPRNVRYNAKPFKVYLVDFQKGSVKKKSTACPTWIKELFNWANGNPHIFQYLTENLSLKKEYKDIWEKEILDYKSIHGPHSFPPADATENFVR